jgi:hypothetical protein
MDSAPVRELEVEEAGLPWGRLFMLSCLAALIGWWFFGGSADGDVADATTRGPRVTLAQPDMPMVTVDSVPAGANVFLEGVGYGRAPTAVPVPTDAKAHELCVEYDGARTCRHLTGEAMAFQDPYRFVIAGQ